MDAAPPGVVPCLLSDEERRGDYGARFVVESRPELFHGVWIPLRYELREEGRDRRKVGAAFIAVTSLVVDAVEVDRPLQEQPRASKQSSAARRQPARPPASLRTPSEPVPA